MVALALHQMHRFPGQVRETFHIRLCHLQNIHPLEDLSRHVDHLIGKHIFLRRLILFAYPI